MFLFFLQCSLGGALVVTVDPRAGMSRQEPVAAAQPLWREEALAAARLPFSAEDDSLAVEAVEEISAVEAGSTAAIGMDRADAAAGIDSAALETGSKAAEASLAHVSSMSSDHAVVLAPGAVNVKFFADALFHGMGYSLQRFIPKGQFPEMMRDESAWGAVVFTQEWGDGIFKTILGTLRQDNPAEGQAGHIDWNIEPTPGINHFVVTRSGDEGADAGDEPDTVDKVRAAVLGAVKSVALDLLDENMELKASLARVKLVADPGQDGEETATKSWYTKEGYFKASRTTPADMESAWMHEVAGEPLTPERVADRFKFAPRPGFHYVMFEKGFVKTET